MPLLAHMVISFTPMFKRNLAIAIPAAPAPFITALISPSFLFTILSAFMRAAAVTIAVPCWSS